MIAPLRRRHRTLIALVGAGSGITLAAALLVRAPAPVMRDVPAALVPTPCLAEATPAPVEAGSYRDAALRVDVRHRGDSSAFCVRWLTPPRYPGLVAYWTPVPVSAGELPAGAIPLGPVGETRDHGFAFPAGTAGHLVLVSVPLRQVVVSGPLPAPPAAP